MLAPRGGGRHPRFVVVDLPGRPYLCTCALNG
jgi:hypothetical protein